MTQPFIGSIQGCPLLRNTLMEPIKPENPRITNIKAIRTNDIKT